MAVSDASFSATEDMTLCQLADELLEYVFQYLGDADARAVQETCRRFYTIISSAPTLPPSTLTVDASEKDIVSRMFDARVYIQSMSSSHSRCMKVRKLVISRFYHVRRNVDTRYQDTSRMVHYGARCKHTSVASSEHSSVSELLEFFPNVSAIRATSCTFWPLGLADPPVCPSLTYLHLNLDCSNPFLTFSLFDNYKKLRFLRLDNYRVDYLPLVSILPFLVTFIVSNLHERPAVDTAEERNLLRDLVARQPRLRHIGYFVEIVYDPPDRLAALLEACIDKKIVTVGLQTVDWKRLISMEIEHRISEQCPNLRIVSGYNHNIDDFPDFVEE